MQNERRVLCAPINLYQVAGYIQLQLAAIAVRGTTPAVRGGRRRCQNAAACYIRCPVRKHRARRERREDVWGGVRARCT